MMKLLRLLPCLLFCTSIGLLPVAGQNKIKVDLEAPQPTLKVERIIQLETNNESLFDVFFRVKVTDRNIFVQDVRQILVFDLNGKYLSKVKRVGHGPQEYVRINNFCYFDGKLYVLASGMNRIQVYSPTGKHLRSISLPLGDAQALLIADDYKAFKYSNDPRGSLIVADAAGKKSVHMVPQVRATSTFSIEVPQPFTRAGGKAFYFPDFLSVVYMLGKTKEEIHKTEFDFGSHTITPEYVAKLEQRSLFDQLKKDKVVCFLNFHPTSQWYGLVFSMGGQVYRWFYNLQSGKQYMSEVKDGLTSKLIVSSTDDCFVEAVDALDFLENPRFAEYRKGRTVEEGDNAVLIFYTVE